jgi:serine/threonine protein kinase
MSDQRLHLDAADAQPPSALPPSELPPQLTANVPATPPQSEGSAAEATRSFHTPALAGVSGQSIGPYKLLQKLGEGGMGEVWMAERSEPVRLVVALKFIKAGFDSRHVLARFEAERQALAMMNHPNIARVLDAGSAGGSPYFVMER